MNDGLEEISLVGSPTYSYIVLGVGSSYWNRDTGTMEIDINILTCTSMIHRKIVYIITERNDL